MKSMKTVHRYSVLNPEKQWSERTLFKMLETNLAEYDDFNYYKNKV